jgi:hypothetical protein
MNEPCEFFLAIANYTDGTVCDWTITATQELALEFLDKTGKRVLTEQARKGMELFHASDLKCFVLTGVLEVREQ